MSSTDALTGKLVELIDQVQGAASAHSADAMNLALLSVQVDGLLTLILFFSGIIALFYINYRLKKYVKRIKVQEPQAYEKEKEDIAIFRGMLLLGSAVIFVGFSVATPWTYVQAISPKLYLAHEIIGKVLN